MPSRRAVPGGSRAQIWIAVLVLLLAAGGFLASQHLGPRPAAAQPRLEANRAIGAAPALPWPARGSAAVYVAGLGIVGTRGDESPRPTASTAKIMTALIILETHPLAPGQPGPEVTITSQDVADYGAAVKRGESVVPVRVGERLNELQLLQGLMLPSGNNFAHILAKWDAGSKDAFVAKMNARATALGMTRTHFDDASGFSPRTVSTPTDLLILGAEAMTDPVFRQTVAMVQTTLPYVGEVKNLNAMLGRDGNIGTKTGMTDEAGGCFVSASVQLVAGKPIEIYAVVLGQDSRDAALKATADLSKAAAASLAQANSREPAATGTGSRRPAEDFPNRQIPKERPR